MPSNASEGRRMMQLSLQIAVLLVVQGSNQSATAVLQRYIESIGGETALRTIQTRITEGEFDNGRGLKTRFVSFEQAPNKRVTIIGSASVASDEGSARGFDGAARWDKISSAPDCA